jgi:DNA polymerase III delta subunit
MVYLFMGPNDFARRQRLEQLAHEYNAELTMVHPGDELPQINELTETTLFGGKRIFALVNLIGQFELEKDVPKLAASDHLIIFVEDKLDKRKTSTTAWLKSPDITVEEFKLPQGAELTQWVINRVEELKGKIDKLTAEYFLQVASPEPSTNKFIETPVDLWQLNNELQKLISFSGGKVITKDMIDEVTTKNNAVEVWDIVNALGERNAAKAYVALEKFYVEESADDKTKTIQLNALLADQFRNLLLVSDFQARRVPDAEILSRTGWKSGRLFVMKKLAGKFNQKQLLSALDKLERLDVELKTSTIPGRTILELIIAQL